MYFDKLLKLIGTVSIGRLVTQIEYNCYIDKVKKLYEYLSI